MKRITLVLGLIALMASVMVVLAAPAIMAADNDPLDDRLDLDDGHFLVEDVDLNSSFIIDEELADEWCSPLSPDAINNVIHDCIFADRNDDLDVEFVSFDWDNGFGHHIGNQEFDLDDVESGDVEMGVDIRNAGDNTNLSPAILQSGNSGNIQNAQGVTQFNSRADDIELEGSSIDID